MNIIVFTRDTNNFYLKPDSSLVKDSQDFFCPDFIKSLTISTTVFVKILRGAKYISSDFANRCYSDIGFGSLIYAEDFLKESSANIYSFSKTTTLDKSTFLSSKIINKEEVNNQNLITDINGRTVFSTSLPQSIQIKLNCKIAEASKYCTLKTGDYLIMELSDRVPIELNDIFSLKLDQDALLEVMIK